MTIVTVAYDTSKPLGERLDPAVRAEIDEVAPSTVDAGDIEESHLQNDIISTNKLKAGAVTHPKLADDAVESNNIKAKNVTTGKIADNAVTAGQAGIGVCTAHDAAGNALTVDFVFVTTAEYDILDADDALEPTATYMISP